MKAVATIRLSHLSILLLSAAALAFEINLTRLLSVAQFYHFAFMAVSLALLGSGASGTFLALVNKSRINHGLKLAGWGFALAVIASYVLILYVPFDSFRIAYDWRQWAVLALHYLSLATPFFCSGVAVGALLAARPEQGNRIYAANLVGSALGCLLAVVLPSLVSGEGTALVTAALGITASLVSQAAVTAQRTDEANGPSNAKYKNNARLALYAIQAGIVLILLLAAQRLPPWLQIRLSPYKSLSYALLYPDATTIYERWNSFSRVDVVRSSSIRSLPGSGFNCPHLPPPELGLTVDGDDLNPISHIAPGFTQLPFTGCLLTALPYRLRPGAHALILEPRGGFDVLVALSEGAQTVTAVESNPLVVEAVRRQGEWAGNLYDDPRVHVAVQEGRTFVRQTKERYDVIDLALTTSQRAVVSGAYSLAEDYAYTVEAFASYLERLTDGGLLAVLRWLQAPPSESVRAFALAVEAVERAGGNPETDIVSLRSYQQIAILIRRGPFTEAELQAIRAFAEPRAFDLVYLPGVHPDEVNRYNILSQPDDYRAAVGLLQATDRETWYRAYSFDVRPPTDDRPFFGHFFKWRQVPAMLAMAGHTWQPFGGAGYFVLLALLGLAIAAAGVLILLPLALRRGKNEANRGLLKTLVYFSLLGLGYLFIEIPLMQRFILFLGHPSWSMAAVLFALLMFSGLGSRVSHRVPLWMALLSIPMLIGGYVIGLPPLFQATMSAPLWGKLLISTAVLAPLGLLMGMPFPKGIALLEEKQALVAWAWAGNGAVSVIASILAMLLSLSWGFSAVLAIGATCYIATWVQSPRLTHVPFPAPRR